MEYVSILQRVLTKEQREAGLFLREDDHFVFLMKRCQEKPLATWNAHKVEVQEILHEAQQYVEQEKSGVSFANMV